MTKAEVDKLVERLLAKKFRPISNGEDRKLYDNRKRYWRLGRMFAIETITGQKRRALKEKNNPT